MRTTMSYWPSTKTGSRLRSGITATVVLAMMSLSLLVSSPASAHPALHLGEGGNGTYLALGDSVAFGYTPPATTSTATYLDASNFTSYANDLAQSLGLTLTNASCPGETTGSMIDPTAPSNGCENTLGDPPGYLTYFPLHVSYTGSQLDYAVSYLKSHPHTRLVTIDIGANDAFVCEAMTDDNCASELPGALASIATNLATIYHAIRVDAGYTHALVALDYYSINYNDPIQVAETEALNQAIIAPTLAAGGIVADGFGAFETASQLSSGDPCVAGLLVKYPGGPSTGCNIHPSPLGHQVLAQAITAALNSFPRAFACGRGLAFHGAPTVAVRH
ncbi:MAG TPA: GDSL-type esterase/lipase family protein [Acidimicrobiales bacterium]|nr:GDSL-type esterase/lipase family protein [Acidimicrobiales bacterium]